MVDSRSTRRTFLQTAAATILSGPSLWAAACAKRTFSEAIPDPEWGKARSDPRIVFELIRLRSGPDSVPAFLARPVASGRYPAVIVIHANRLSEPYIGDTTAMLARAGFVGLAVDVFHFLPGNQSWEASRAVPGSLITETLNREFRESRLLRDVGSGIAFLRSQSFTQPGGVGLVGFCGGGWNALLLAAQTEDVGAVVAFYAPLGLSDAQHRAPLDLAQYIRIPVQYHQPGRDEFVRPADVDRFEAVMRAQGTPIERFLYPEAHHGFFAFNRSSFAAVDAAPAWRRAVTFLRDSVGRPVKHRPVTPPLALMRADQSVATDKLDHWMLH